MSNGKKWSILLLILSACTLILVGALTFFVDPFFHYRKPADFLQYPIDNERYQNDGIVKHFNYDAIITGTSMSENFKASECDALFGVNSVKTCFNGTTMLEISNHLRRALKANTDIQLIIQGIDGWSLLDDAGLIHGDDRLPTYLYDEKPLNDVNYLLNKEILLSNTMGVLKHTLKGRSTTTFDEYANWNQWPEFGKGAVLSGYDRPEKSVSHAPLSLEDQENVTQVVYQHAISLAQKYPQVQFYYFFTPYSIVYMDEQNQYGILHRQMDAYRLASAQLLAVENIHLFSFFTDYENITELSHYIDPCHYHEDINSLILERMANGEYELTLENYEAHWNTVENFYASYDYESIFH